MITRIKFSSSIRIGTNEFTFIDTNLDAWKHLSVEVIDGKVILNSTKFPSETVVTSMANVVYYAMESKVEIESRTELCPENIIRIDTKAIEKESVQDSGRVISKTSTSNKRRK